MVRKPMNRLRVQRNIKKIIKDHKKKKKRYTARNVVTPPLEERKMAKNKWCHKSLQSKKKIIS